MEINKEENLETGVNTGCTLKYFTEYEEILSLIKTIENIYKDNKKFEKSFERFQFIVEEYREQSHLLDSHLDEILDEIVVVVRDENFNMNIKHCLFKYLYLITNVRGYKVIVKKLPHEVSDLKPVLCMLEEQNPDELEYWETRYCLLLWLSIIVKIPFDMSRFDCGDQGVKSVMDRILDVCHTYILIIDACNKMAAYLVSQFITRTDVKQVHLEPFLKWCAGYFANSECAVNIHFGPLSALSYILKFGKREDLLPHSSYLLEMLISAEIRNDPYRLTRKYYVKLVQRLGLTFLKIRIAKWRYKRGNRILAIDKVHNNQKLTSLGDDNEDGEENFDVPSQVEEVINELLEALKDPDITVRWSAAKGIGRVTNRLPKDLADDVIASVFDFLSPREKDPAWHGACLALAELGKRGLLLAHRLPDAVSCIMKALVYDEPKGFCSVGSYIRDAACYVCWAFARAYDTKTLDPFVQDIATGLLIVTCYDKEVNCRRAASAAFQELVGRQGGTLPHGIGILTRADYFSVGIRNNAYLDISIYIAQHNKYTKSFIDHLTQHKVGHWDMEIRKVTAKTLHKLVKFDCQYFIDVVIEDLLKKIDSIDLNGRHGATLCVGDIVHALVSEGHTIPDEKWIRIKNIVKNYRAKKQLQGLSGEMTKQACCYMIEQLCKVSLKTDDGDWLELINECLDNEADSVKAHACQALNALCNSYYGNSTGAVDDTLIKKYIHHLKSTSETAREGHSLALGTLPEFMLLSHLEVIVSSLIESTRITSDTLLWSFSRKNSVEALTLIVRKLGTNTNLIKFVPELFECYLTGTKEYTKDRRGDIGRMVRESSMYGLQTLIQICVSLDPTVLCEDYMTRSLCALLKQAVERIDNTRGVAGEVFISILHNDPDIPNIPNRSELLTIFTKDVVKSINWIHETNTFPLFSQVLALDVYTYDLMSGLVLSIGGLSERLVKHSFKNFISFLKVQPKEKLLHICDIIIKLCKETSNNDEIVVPLWYFLDKLLGSYSINSVLEESDNTFLADLYLLIKTEMKKSKNLTKLKAGVEVYCQLLQFSSTRKKGLSQLITFLTHNLAFLRKHVALRLHESIMMLSEELLEGENVSEADIDVSLKLLSETDWGDVNKEPLITMRNEIFVIYHFTPPPRIQKKE